MSTGRRVAWGLSDQVLASASNFVVTILAARSLAPSAFGSFVVALAAATVSVFVARGLASDPLSTVHAQLGERGDNAASVRAGAATALAASLLVAAVAAVTAACTDGATARTWWVLCAILPGVTLQDYLRYALIVRGDARRTFVNDLFWMVLQVPLMVGAAALGGGPAALLLAWGVAGTLAAGLGFWQVGAGVGRWHDVVGWLREHRSIWPFFLLDNAVYQLTQLLVVVAISVFAGLADVAGFRAAVTLYAPLAVIGRGIVGVAVPELARRSDDAGLLRRASLILALGLTPLPFLWAGLIEALPSAVPTALLGGSWRIAEPLFLPAGVTVAASLFTVGTVVGIRALAAGREGLTARVYVSLLVLAAGIAGAALDGGRGAMWMVAATAPVQMAVWWRLLEKAVAGGRRVALPVPAA